MLDRESEAGSDNKAEVTADDIQGLQQLAKRQARQISDLIDVLGVLTTQLTARATMNGTSSRPKMASPEKYAGGQAELAPFLTNINLYYAFNEVPSE